MRENESPPHYVWVWLRLRQRRGQTGKDETHVGGLPIYLPYLGDEEQSEPSGRTIYQVLNESHHIARGKQGGFQLSRCSTE